MVRLREAVEGRLGISLERMRVYVSVREYLFIFTFFILPIDYISYPWYHFSHHFSVIVSLKQKKSCILTSLSVRFSLKQEKFHSCETILAQAKMFLLKLKRIFFSFGHFNGLNVIIYYNVNDNLFVILFK